MIYGIIIVACIFVAFKLVEGIDSMKNLHPEYEGEDFL